MMKIALLYATFPNMKEAEKCSASLLQKKLVACANLFESRSFYNWKNKLRTGKEVVGLFKTTLAKSSTAEKEIMRHHSYEVPCVLKMPIFAEKRYGNWVQKEIRQ